MIIPLRLDLEVPEEAAVYEAYKSRPLRRRQEFMRRLLIQALKAGDPSQAVQRVASAAPTSEMQESDQSASAEIKTDNIDTPAAGGQALRGFF